MSSSPSEVRQRKKEPAPAPPSEKKPRSPAALARAEDSSSFGLLDAARGVVLLLLVSSAVSYFVTRESLLWNVRRPDFTRPEVVKTWFQGPKQYTDADLLLHDGRDPNIPLLLAINGTIYDVSAGRRHYGPKGSYHLFAGADASRAFVTTCFKEDRNPDMRGLEEMFLPFDDPEVDALYTPAQMRLQKAKELIYAKEQVYEALKHWVDFFENNGKYPKIGKVKRKPGWETRGPVPTLCKQAADGRPKRRNPPPGKTLKSQETKTAE